jgi:hypothetical protein
LKSFFLLLRREILVDHTKTYGSSRDAKSELCIKVPNPLTLREGTMD